jgi:hypothetical protein
MTIAWFKAESAADSDPLDDTPSLVAELAARHEVVRYEERRAHDFVWEHARRPYDICVYELAETGAAGFIWPYLLHYPGIVRLRSASVHASRARYLQDARRASDYAAEMAFAGRPLIRIPLLASRLTVVGDLHTATTLQAEYPDVRIRHAPLGVMPPGLVSADSVSETKRGFMSPLFGVVDTTDLEMVQRAAQRARAAGSSLELHHDITDARTLSACDAIVALRWPPGSEPPLAALQAMSAGLPAIVHESGVTASWPAFNPQTWRPRGYTTDTSPVVVSIDPMDEEHSLMLAMRRLADDASLRRRIGDAAQSWWRANATPAVSASAWQRLFAEAATVDAPMRPPDWPRHLDADGTQAARAILAEFGASVDFLK